jgi:hypothetical protein
MANDTRTKNFNDQERELRVLEMLRRAKALLEREKRHAAHTPRVTRARTLAKAPKKY